MGLPDAISLVSQDGDVKSSRGESETRELLRERYLVVSLGDGESRHTKPVVNPIGNHGAQRTKLVQKSV